MLPSETSRTGQQGQSDWLNWAVFHFVLTDLQLHLRIYSISINTHIHTFLIINLIEKAEQLVFLQSELYGPL